MIHEGCHCGIEEEKIKREAYKEALSFFEGKLDPYTSDKQRLTEFKKKFLPKQFQKVEEEKTEEGFFDGVKTWYEAIEKIKEANDKYCGRFVEINREIFFDLRMYNDKSWNFAKGKKTSCQWKKIQRRTEVD